MKKNIAIIPARGGSQRIPNKNIIDFCGKPLISWTIQAALESKLFDDVVVSTDSKKIAEVALQSGAQCPFLRTEDTANHFSPVSEATIWTLEKLKEDPSFGNYENVVQLMATCPLRNTQDIKAAFAFFEQKKSAFVLSCFQYGWMNPWWAFKRNENHQSEKLFPSKHSARSQDLEDLFCPSGAIWIAKCEELIQKQSFIGEQSLYYEINWKSAIDIDEKSDLEMAQAVHSMLQKQHNGLLTAK